MTTPYESLDEARNELAAPFPADQLEWRAQQDSNDSVLVFPYIQRTAVIARLNEVLGPENWRETAEFCTGYHTEYDYNEKMEVEKSYSGMVQKLEVYDPEKDIFLAKVGSSTIGKNSAFKSADTGAFKRAASKWTVGLYLNYLPDFWVDKALDNDGIYGGKDDKGSYYFFPPQLPDWALPGGSGRPPQNNGDRSNSSDQSRSSGSGGRGNSDRSSGRGGSRGEGRGSSGRSSGQRSKRGSSDSGGRRSSGGGGRNNSRGNRSSRGSGSGRSSNGSTGQSESSGDQDTGEFSRDNTVPFEDGMTWRDMDDSTLDWVRNDYEKDNGVPEAAEEEAQIRLDNIMNQIQTSVDHIDNLNFDHVMNYFFEEFKIDHKSELNVADASHVMEYLENLEQSGEPVEIDNYDALVVPEPQTD